MYSRIVQCVCILVGITLLSACGPIYNTSYQYHPPTSLQGRQCIVQCSRTKEACQHHCNSDVNQCRSLAMQQANFDYNAYVNARNVRREPVERDLNSFYNPSQCNTSCNCEPEFNNCYTLCGGHIETIRKCVAFCDQQK